MFAKWVKCLVVLGGFAADLTTSISREVPQKSVCFVSAYLKIQGYMPDVESEPFLDSLRITPLQVESTKRTAHTHTQIPIPFPYSGSSLHFSPSTKFEMLSILSPSICHEEHIRITSLHKQKCNKSSYHHYIIGLQFLQAKNVPLTAAISERTYLFLQSNKDTKKRAISAKSGDFDSNYIDILSIIFH